MGTYSKIEWCDATFNPVRGCTKVSDGCKNCYAERGSKRNPGVLGEWGPSGTRVVAAESQWEMVERMNREAACIQTFACNAGDHADCCPQSNRPRIFVGSYCDWAEDWQGRMRDANGREVWVDRWGLREWEPADDSPDFAFEHRPLTMADVRGRLFELIDRCPNIDFLMLTKRAENIRRMCPRTEWDTEPDSEGITHANKYRPNVWLGTSIEDQSTADERIPHLLACRDLAPVLFLSYEPALAPARIPLAGIDWVIVGGESGTNARRCNVEWIRSIVRQCEAARVPCFVKQLGSNPISFDRQNRAVKDAVKRYCYVSTTGDTAPLRDPKGGDMDEWPDDLKVRQVPEVKQ